jgi:hypothetical protein
MANKGFFYEVKPFDSHPTRVYFWWTYIQEHEVEDTRHTVCRDNHGKPRIMFYEVLHTKGGTTKARRKRIVNHPRFCKQWGAVKAKK